MTDAIEASKQVDRSGLGRSATFTRERYSGKHINHFQQKIAVHCEVHVEWIEDMGGGRIMSIEDLQPGLEMSVFPLCDSLGDYQASPSADYQMLATDAIAERIKR
jgi:hypothetical protein